MAGDTDVKGLESEYEMEGNVPADGGSGYGGDTEGALAEPAEAAPSTPEPPAGKDIERESRELAALSEIENDNVAILDKELQFEAERKAAKEGEADPEEEEAESEEPEAEKEEESEEETEAATEETTELREWLRSLDPEDRKELIRSMMEEEGFAATYNANGEEVNEPLPEIIRKAAGYAGQEKLREQAREVSQQRAAIELQLNEIETQKEQVQKFRDDLVAQVDDPKKFTNWLTQNSDLDYLRGLRDTLNETVEEAESNPTTFNLTRQVSGLEAMFRQFMESQMGGAAPGEPSGHSAEPEKPAPNGDVPSNFGFKPGVGYPDAHLNSAWRSLEILLQGSKVTPAEAAKKWQEDGMRRPVFDVARDLMRSQTANRQKAQLAKTPPVMRRPERNRVTGKSVSKSSAATPRNMPFENIEEHLANAVRKAQEAGEL